MKSHYLSSAFQIVKEQVSYETIFKYSLFFLEKRTKTLKDGGAMRDRTADLLAASEALSQLSYSPIWKFFLL